MTSLVVWSSGRACGSGGTSRPEQRAGGQRVALDPPDEPCDGSAPLRRAFWSWSTPPTGLFRSPHQALLGMAWRCATGTSRQRVHHANAVISQWQLRRSNRSGPGGCTVLDATLRPSR